MSYLEKISIKERGIGRLTFIVFGTLVAIIVYCGYRIVPFYYYYFEIRNQIISAATRAADLKDKEIRQRVAGHIRYLGIPADADSLVINRYSDTIRVVLSYEEEFYITFRGKDYTVHIFPFTIDETVHY